MSLDTWLGEGAAVEADWSGHVSRLALRGALGRAGPSLLLDLPALSAPYACDTARCTPGLRAPRTRSCCADLDVELGAAEVAALAGAEAQIAAAMAPLDGRWSAGAPTWAADGMLTRPGRRCVFSVLGPSGALSCGLHRLEDDTGRPRGALKPLACRLFPLLVVDLGEGLRLLTAVNRANVKHGVPSPRHFPCLRAPGPATTVADETVETLRGLWGARVAGTIVRAARAFSP